MARPSLLLSLPLAAALLLSLPAAAPAGDPSPVDEAFQAYQAGEYAKAAEKAESVPAGDPLYARARYLAGEARLALGEAEPAEKAFRAALEKKPGSAPILAGLGRALTARGSLEEALKVLQEAVKADGKDAGARRSLGEAFAAQGKVPEARKELEAAAKLDPKDPLAARALVEILLRSDDLEAAGRAAEVHARSDPKGAMGDFLRGLVLDRSKKGKDAIASYEAALAKDPKFLDAHKNLAILCVTDNPSYTNRERTRKAFDHFAKYFELGGKDEELRRTYETIKGFLEGDRGGK
jgi:tetratricopeptide (TPR) repeat protein